MNKKERIKKIIEIISEGLYEKEEIFKMSMLAMLAGESIFLLGKPGIAKSLVARRIKFAIRSGNIFEYLMNKFSALEDIFGPISITELQKGKYIRLIDKYLPTSNIAFLDEIWKSGPSILNNLLTIINEKLFRNGSEDIKVPLWLLIAASNELPEANKGLEALYDRFIIRIIAKPLVNKENFHLLLKSNTKIDVNIPPELQIGEEEYNVWLQEQKNVIVTDSTIAFIDNFKKDLIENSTNEVYISDRRWTKIIKLMKASAYYNDRKYISKSDWMVIPYCIWDDESQEDEYNKIFENSFKNNIMLDYQISFKKIKNKISEIKKEMSNIAAGKFAIKEFKDIFLGKLNGTYYKLISKEKEPYNKYISLFDYELLSSAPNSSHNIEIYIESDSELPKINKMKAKLKSISSIKVYNNHKKIIYTFEKKLVTISKIKELENNIVLLSKKYNNIKKLEANEIVKLNNSTELFFDEKIKKIMSEIN